MIPQHPPRHRDDRNPLDNTRPAGWMFLAAIALLVALATLAYPNSFAGVFLLDDLSSIVDNSSIRDPNPAVHLLQGGARGLVQWTFALNYRYGGLDPWSYHLVNLAIHTLTAIALLVFSLLCMERVRDCCPLSPKDRLAIATLVAALWIVHPLNTQAVTYIVQRAEAMAALCTLAFLIFYLLAAEKKPAFLYYLLALLALALGVLSKETALMAIPIAIVLDASIGRWSAGTIFRRRWKFWTCCLVPCLAIVPHLLRTIFATGETVGLRMEEVTWWEYVRTQPQVWLHYLRLCLVPHPLRFDYGWPPETRVPVLLGSWLVMVLLAAYQFYLFRTFRWLSFWGIAAALFLVPTTVIPLLDLAVEHRMYLPLAFLIAFVVIFLGSLAARRGSTRQRRFFLAGASAAIGGCVLLTIARNEVYHSPITMWSDVIDKSTSSSRRNMLIGRAYSNLGVAYGDRGQWDRATEMFEQAANSEYQPPDLRGNRLRVLIALNQLDAAEEEVKLALQIQPSSAKIIQQAGLIAAKRRRLPEAIEYFTQAYAIEPENLDIGANLAFAMASAGDFASATKQYESLLQKDPRYLEARMRLIEMYLDAGRADDAELLVSSFTSRFPADRRLAWHAGLVQYLKKNFEGAIDQWTEASHPQKYLYLGNASLKLNRYTEAEKSFRRHLEIDPRSIDALMNLGGLLIQRDPSAAEEQFLRILRIDPSQQRAKYNLAFARIRQGKTDDGLAILDKILADDPDFVPAQELRAQYQSSNK